MILCLQPWNGILNIDDDPGNAGRKFLKFLDERHQYISRDQIQRLCENHKGHNDPYIIGNAPYTGPDRHSLKQISQRLQQNSQDQRQPEGKQNRRHQKQNDTQKYCGSNPQPELCPFFIIKLL